jgi:hypothetical protein
MLLCCGTPHPRVPRAFTPRRPRRCPAQVKCERFLRENAPFQERRLNRSPAYFCLRLSPAKPFDSTFGSLIG